MIRRLLTSLATVATVALCANADTLDILPTFGSSGWGSTYDAATQTITYESDWTGRGWWLAPGDKCTDYSAYDEIVIETKDNTIGYSIVIEYAAEGSNTSVSVEKGMDKGSATLDAERKNAVKQIYLQGHEAGTLTLTAAYLQNEEVVDPSLPVVLWEGEQAIDWWGNAVDLTPNDFIKAKAAAGDKLIVNYKAEEGDAFKVIYVDKDWAGQNLPCMTKEESYNAEYGVFNLPVDQTEYTLTLDAEDIAIVTNTENHAIKFCGDKVTLTKLTLIHAGTSAVENIAVDENAPVEYYNLQGVRIAEPAEGGIYIRRQGNKASKILVK